MTPEEDAQAKASDDNLAGIIAGRRRAARALLAPPGPAAAVKAAWAPVREAMREARTPANDRDE